MSFQKHFIDCSWGKVNIVENTKAPSPVYLCLHGWLDNWTSFKLLSDFLPGRMIALDLPGHGTSEHLPEGNWYHFIDYVVRLKEIVDKLQINQFHIIGHSMGAAIGSLFTATFPELVYSLSLIDGFGPVISPPENAKEILRNSILKLSRKKSKSRIYKNKEMAVKARFSAGEMKMSTAEILVDGQMEKTSAGWKWTYDLKLTNISSLRMTRDQLKSFLSGILCPTLLLTVKDGFVEKSSYWQDRQLIKSLIEKSLPGGHHIHMDEPQLTADEIKSFWIQNLFTPA